MKKTIILVSIFLTVFVLGIIAAVSKVVADSRQPAAVSTAEVQALLQEREAAYTQLIDQANQRLSDASQTIDTLNNQVNQLQSDQPKTNDYIPLQQAAQTALASAGAGESLAKIPESVDYQGKPAYEVSMADGAVVYVSAASGEVLYNSLTGDTSPVVNAEQAAEAALAYMKGGKVKSVEREMLKDVAMYKVTFTTGSVAYVNMRGEVAYVKIVKNAVVSTPSTSSSNSSSSSSSSSSDRNEDDHEDDEHEDDDHDD